MSNLAIIDDATEIMQSLPHELHNDSHMIDCVIEGLSAGLQKHEVRLIAVEAAQTRLENAMTQGFKLVNGELVEIKQGIREDRIHAEYAKKELAETKNLAQQAWQEAQKLAIGVAKAEAKADGARDLAKNSRSGIDPLVGMAVGSLLVVLTLIFFVRVERVEDKPRTNSQSIPTYSCDHTAVNVAGTTDFGKCKKLSGEV